MAVDNLPPAGDNQQQYRPLEVLEITTLTAVRAMRSVFGEVSSGKTSAIAFSAVQPHRLDLLKAASNAFVATEQALRGVEPNRLQNRLYAHQRQASGPLVADRGSNLLPIPPPNSVLLEGAEGPMNASAGSIYSATDNVDTPSTTG